MKAVTVSKLRVRNLPAEWLAPTRKELGQSDHNGFLIQISNPGAQRNDNIAGLRITDHQTSLTFSEVHRYQQTDTGIESVLIALAGRNLFR